MSLYIGLLSGTSMDGIDAALVDVETHQLLYGVTKKYSSSLRACILEIISAKVVNVAQLCEINTLIGHEFAEAVLHVLQETKISPDKVQAIGSHGQTIAHDTNWPIPYTLQLGCGHVIAERTKIPVVADFRTRDLVAGGQGAPLAPLYHQVIFKHLMQKNLAIVNIGGIANVSILSQDRVKGWDVGPGNCLLDAWIKKHKGQSYDEAGAWAAQGQVLPSLLHDLQADVFFSNPPPKSIGKEYFSLDWLASFLPSSFEPQDVQATLMALTVWSIAEAIPKDIEVLICGGGVHNKAMMGALSKAGCAVQSTETYQISADYLEAMMFAWLASQAVKGIPVDLCAMTGSASPVLLGVLYPALR